MRNIIWIGKYQEDITTTHFRGSICLFGYCKENHFVFNEDDGMDFYTFVHKKVKHFISLDSDSVFCFYDPSFAYKFLGCIDSSKIICLNSKELLDWLNNKSITRQWIRNIIKTPETVVLSHDEITIENLKEIFLGYQQFVVQEMVSSGGNGTYLLSENTSISVSSGLYMVSPYYKESVSINATILIHETGTIVFPISLQHIDIYNNKLMYAGSDFISANSLPLHILDKLKDISMRIGQHLKFMNYKGICGIDFLYYNDDIYFLEINPRFQGSSFLIDKELQNQNMSLFQLNYDAFYGLIDDDLIKRINDVKIKHSFYIKDFTRITLKEPLVSTNMEYDTVHYYDYFAEKYHIMLEDYEDKIDKQGKIIKKIFEKYAKRNVETVLDCTCGIGIQALSLAQEGFSVIGSDISKNELKVAEREAKRRKIDIDFICADCRYLEKTIVDKFDVIISIDSAMPHLVTKENFITAFKSIYNRLKKGGVFLSSYRDYEEIMRTKPNMAYPVRFNSEGDIEYTILRKWKWEDDIIFSRQYVIEDSPSDSRLYTANYKQWAVTKKDLFSIAEQASFSEIYWLLPVESGFSQPMLCLLK